MDDTVGQMTITQLREMFEGVVGDIIEHKLAEIFADPGEALEIREPVFERLTQQMQAVASGELGQDFKDVAREKGFGVYEPYTIRILENAVNELESIEESVARRIARRIIWLSSNLDYVQPKRLKEGVKGLYKLRAGDYRVVYEILSDRRTIVVHVIGHLEEVHEEF
ncbi:MAG: type II toxin-antitoxin system RelE/ParE family toxin [Desulfobacterales bacterium]|nr:type II toxin-antitoxin system RelE/ParE family toxin [Desulfobacterales bacterium]